MCLQCPQGLSALPPPPPRPRPASSKAKADPAQLGPRGGRGPGGTPQGGRTSFHGEPSGSPCFPGVIGSAVLVFLSVPSRTQPSHKCTAVTRSATAPFFFSRAFPPLCFHVQSVLVAQSRPILCSPMDCSLPSSSVHADSPGKNSGVGCHALLQGIFSTRRWSPGLLHCRWILYQLSHQGSRKVTPKEVTPGCALRGSHAGLDIRPF